MLFGEGRLSPGKYSNKNLGKMSRMEKKIIQPKTSLWHSLIGKWFLNLFSSMPFSLPWGIINKTVIYLKCTV